MLRPGLLFALLFPLTFGIMRGQEWTKIQVTDRGDGYQGETILPTLVIDPAQVIHVLYARTDGADSALPLVSRDVSLLYTHNGGGSFVSSIPLFQGSGSPFGTLSIDSSTTLSAMFLRDRAPDSRCLEFSRGKPPVVWNNTPTGQCGASFPALATDPSGRIHVTFVRDGKIFYMYRDPSPPSAWSTPVDISVAQETDELPSIAVSGSGEVHIVFYRRNSDTRQTLCYSTGSGTAFSPPVSLRLLSRTTARFEQPYLWPSHAPSIAVDREGSCHLVFTSVFGLNPESAHILYANNRNGTWNEPAPITGIGFYNRVSITGDHDGNLHVGAERFDGNDWDIIYLQRRNGAWIAEQDLTANDVDDFAGGSGGRFIAVRDSAIALAYQTFEKIDPGRPSPADKNEIAVLTTILSPEPVLSLSPDTIDFGTIRVGTCRDSGLLVTNIGTGRLETTAPHGISGGGNAFLVRGEAHFSIQPSAADSVRLRFCPPDKGPFEGRLRIVTNAGERIVLLRGIGEANRTPYRLSLDTATARVGDPFLLTMSLSPKPTADAKIDSFSIELAFDPNALFFHRLVDGNGARLSPAGHGRIRIERPPGSFILDSILFRLECEGLLSGRPVNTVAITGASFLGVTRTIDTAGGLVYLEGCDIAGDVRFGRRVGVMSIRPNPGSDEVVIRWRGPEGSHPQLRLLDQLGRILIDMPLPTGTGLEQELPLDLQSLKPGLYGLLLIDRDEYSSTPLMILR